jgi:hypothetical protein
MTVLGRTHHRWRPEVRAVVDQLHRRFPQVECNTYIDHPWPGWDGLSVDVWGEGGRGDPLQGDVGWRIVRYLMRLPGKPLIRHIIYEHSLWRDISGWSYWAPEDHSGALKHVHITYLP